MTPCEEKGMEYILQPGDCFRVTDDCSEEDYRKALAKFSEAGCRVYPLPYSTVRGNLLGWGLLFDCIGHNPTRGNSFTRELTLNEVLNSSKKEEVLSIIEDSEGNPHVEVGTQTETNNLVDQLEEALAKLEAAEKEVERLKAAYREAYPLINGIVPLQKDMNDPKSWKKGDVVISEEYAEDISAGHYYTLSQGCEQASYGLLIHFKDDAGDVRIRDATEYRFSHRPQ